MQLTLHVNRIHRIKTSMFLLAATCRDSYVICVAQSRVADALDLASADQSIRNASTRQTAQRLMHACRSTVMCTSANVALQHDPVHGIPMALSAQYRQSSDAAGLTRNYWHQKLHLGKPHRHV